MSSYNLVVAGANKVLSCGNYICVQIPLGALSAYWKAQMFFVTLPYRCALRFLDVLRRIISEFVGPPIQQTTQKILHEFLIRESSERNGLIRSIQEIREHTIVAVKRIEAFKEELNRCRYKVHEWKTETERRTKEMTSLAKEEKKLLRVVIGALKHLRRLKGSRAVLDEHFKHTLEELVNFSRSLSQKREELSESALGSPGVINGNLKSAYNRLQNQANQLKEFTEKRRKVLDRVSLTSGAPLTSKEIGDLVDASSPKKITITDSELVSIGVDTLQSIVYVLNAENGVLKRRLKLTNDQLSDVKATSECLSEKVNELQLHLDNVKDILRTTEEERDVMCFKLSLLSEMIEEQEKLLNETSQNDSMSSYQTAPGYSVNELRSSFAADSEPESYGISSNEYDES